jgi:glycosyltransferase involved in cell wall biosynthesis
MKILIDARLYGLENAGLGRYVINLIKELQKIDRKNEYVVLLKKKYFNKLNFPDRWEKILADFGHYGLKEQILLPRVISKINPDIVHFPHFNVPIFSKRNFVVTIHDLLMHKFRGKSTTTLNPIFYYLKRLGYHLVFKKAVVNASKIMVPTKWTKEKLIEEYNLPEDKLVVTYEGVGEEISKAMGNRKILKKYGLSNDYFIYAGNAYPHKNIGRAIEAALQLNKETKSEALFVIASSRDVFTKKLEEKVKAMQAQKYIKILGFVPDEDLWVLYKYAKALVYPSLSEGFGLQGLEAMAAGTLVLASDIAVFKEVYKDHAIYFNPYDFSSILGAMWDVLKMDENKRRKKISEALKFVKRYSWVKMAKQTLKVYESSFGL